MDTGVGLNNMSSNTVGENLSHCDQDQLRYMAGFLDNPFDNINYGNGINIFSWEIPD